MKKYWTAAVTAIILILVGIGLALGEREMSQEDIERELAEGRFAQGVTVNDIDISSMSMEQAREAVKKAEWELAQDTVMYIKVGEREYRLAGDDFDISYDTDEVLKQAMLAGKGGNAFKRAIGKNDDNMSFFIEKSVNGTADDAALKELIEQESKNPKDASAQFTPNNSTHMTYTRSEEGVSIDLDELKKAVNEAIDDGKLTVEAPAQFTQPKVTTEELEQKIVRRAYFETSYAQYPYNDADRVSNIKKCVAIINSKRLTLAPGQSMSLNDVLGPRTEAGGWKLAPGYVSGRSEDQAGGGVCQISSTLYCAAVKADITILNRKNHTIPVGYVNQGLDATISTGGPDLVIRNDTGENIYICCGLSGKQSVYFEVYGAPFKGFTKIALMSKKVRDIQPESDIVYTYTDEMKSGQEEVYVKRRNGSEYAAYASYYDADKLVKQKKLSRSVYPAYSGEIRVGR